MLDSGRWQKWLQPDEQGPPFHSLSRRTPNLARAHGRPLYLDRRGRVGRPEPAIRESGISDAGPEHIRRGANRGVSGRATSTASPIRRQYACSRRIRTGGSSAMTPESRSQATTRMSSSWARRNSPLPSLRALVEAGPVPRLAGGRRRHPAGPSRWPRQEPGREPQSNSSPYNTASRFCSPSASASIHRPWRTCAAWPLISTSWPPMALSCRNPSWKSPPTAASTCTPASCPPIAARLPSPPPSSPASSETGVSIMLMDEGMDTGPVLAQARQPILAGDTTAVAVRPPRRTGRRVACRDAAARGLPAPSPPIPQERTAGRTVRLVA